MLHCIRSLLICTTINPFFFFFFFIYDFIYLPVAHPRIVSFDSGTHRAKEVVFYNSLLGCRHPVPSKQREKKRSRGGERGGERKGWEREELVTLSKPNQKY